MSNTAGVLLKAGTAYPSLLGFSGVCVAHLFSFLCCVFLLCLSSSYVLCTQCCQFLWIVHYCFPLQFSLMFIIITLRDHNSKQHFIFKSNS